MCLKFFIRCILILLYGQAIAWADDYDSVLFEKIFEEHCHILKHLEKTHPKMIIMFSGTPGMGKTTVAKRLEEQFQALRISRDDIRNILRKFELSLGIVEEYLPWVMQKLSLVSPNHFIILDCSIDRTYPQCMELAKKHLFETFLIRMHVDKDCAIERIKARQRQDEKALLANFDKLWQDYQLFGQSTQSDYIFDNNHGIEEPFGQLVERIHQKAPISSCI